MAVVWWHGEGVRGVEDYDHGSERMIEREMYICDGLSGATYVPCGFFEIRKAPLNMFRQLIRRRHQELD